MSFGSRLRIFTIRRHQSPDTESQTKLLILDRKLENITSTYLVFGLLAIVLKYLEIILNAPNSFNF